MPNEPAADAKADGKQDLWQSILKDVSSHTTSARRLGKKTLLVLGREGAGKSTLISRLQGRKYHREEHPQGTGLEYTYLDVKDDESGEDVISRLGVYLLDGNPEHRNLLSFVLNKETIQDTSVVIVVDMARPWLMLSSLEYWVNVLQEHINGLGVDENVLQEMKTKLVRDFQSYTEEPVSAEKREKEGDEAEVLLPLEAGVLVHNLGIPITVVCNKCDAASTLEKDHDYRNEHFDFIQLNLRKFCVEYGAGLIYNGKEGKTKDVLYKYLLHKAYGLPFTHKASIAERDAVVVPAGWDNLTKISVLHGGLKTIEPADAFSKHILPPASRKSAAAEEVEAEDEQEFLQKQQQVLAQAGKDGDSSSSAPRSIGQAVGTPTQTRGSVSNVPRPTTSAQPAAGGAAAAPGKDGKNADVLANFFNSLLNKKPAGAAAGGAAAAGKKEDDK